MSKRKYPQRLIYGPAAQIAQNLQLPLPVVDTRIRALERRDYVEAYYGKENRLRVAITPDGETALQTNVFASTSIEHQILAEAYAFCANQDRTHWRIIPVVHVNERIGQATIPYYPDTPPDTAAWFAWLNRPTMTLFKLYGNHDYCLGFVEKDDQQEWRAYRKYLDRVRTIHLGRSESVTTVKLIQAFNDLIALELQEEGGLWSQE